MTSDPVNTGAAPDKAGEQSKNAIQDLRDVLLAAASDAHKRGSDEWPYLTDELDKWLDLLSARGEAVVDEARVQLHLGVLEASERARALEGAVSGALKAIKEKGQPAKAALEEAEVHSHLLKLDAQDAVKERAARLKKLLSDAKAAAVHPVVTAEEELVRVVQTWASLYH